MPLGRRRKITNGENNSKSSNKISDLNDNSTKEKHGDIEQSNQIDDVTIVKTSVDQVTDMTLKPEAESTVSERESTQTVPVRSSTRVSKPPRRETYSPPHSPVKKQCKIANAGKEKGEGTPKTKRAWELWSTDEKTVFFEGLAEYGKDFDAIQNLITQKYKKKGCDPKMMKNKDQVRHFYYRTWHKISAYAPPKEPSVKKRVQELYGLINYGELRKKIRGSLNEKGGKKLTELILSGMTTIKVRGKNIRIRTPVCKVLKKINKIDDHKEPNVTNDHKVPDKVTVELTPRDNKSWSYVQMMSQNPRSRIILRPETKLAAIIAYLENKWRPINALKKEKLLGKPQNDERPIRLFAHRDCEITPVNLSMAKQQPPPQLDFNNFLRNVLGIVRPQSPVGDNQSDPREVEPGGGNSENSLSGHEGGGVISSPEVLAPDIMQLLKSKQSENVSSWGREEVDNSVNTAVDRSTTNSDSLVPGCVSRLLLDDENAQFPQEFSLNSRTESVEEGRDRDYTTDTAIECTDINDLPGNVKASNFSKDGTAKNSDFDKLDTINPLITNHDKVKDQEDTEKYLQNCDREKLLQKFKSGWIKTDCEDVSLAELFVIFGKEGTLRMQYTWDNFSRDDSTRCSPKLAHLLLVAAAQYNDLVAKVKAPQEKPATQLCSKCSSNIANKSTTRRVTKPSQDTTQCREAVFRVPTQPIKSVPCVPSAIQSPLELQRHPHEVTNMHSIRPRAIRKQIMVQRRLLPKSSQLVAYTMPIQSSNIAVTSLPSSLKQSASLRSILPANHVTSLPATIPHSSLVMQSNSGAMTAATNFTSSSTGETSPMFTAVTTPLSVSTATLDHVTTGDHDTTISPTNLSALLDISLPPPQNISDASTDRLLDIAFGHSNSSFSGLLESAGHDDQSTFKLGGENQWLNGEGADISLGSLLAESPVKRALGTTTTALPPSLFSDNSRDFLAKHDVDSQIQSMMNDSSVDLVSKFADIAAQLNSEQPSGT